jgi:hypothetical protein
VDVKLKIELSNGGRAVSLDEFTKTSSRSHRASRPSGGRETLAGFPMQHRKNHHAPPFPSRDAPLPFPKPKQPEVPFI